MLVFLIPCFAIMVNALCTYFLIKYSHKSNVKKIKCGNHLFHITIIFNAKHKTKKDKLSFCNENIIAVFFCYIKSSNLI